MVLNKTNIVNTYYVISNFNWQNKFDIYYKSVTILFFMTSGLHRYNKSSWFSIFALVIHIDLVYMYIRFHIDLV